MLPREHGAYSQMLLPLVTSFVIAGVTVPGALTGLTVVLGFLAHEPLMVLLGRRGVRVRDERAARARALLGCLGVAMAAMGAVAILLSPADVRPWFGLPLIPAVVVAAGAVTKQEKSGPAEIAVALAFSLAAVPICLSAGAATAVALGVALPFAIVFVAGVLAVRVVILKVRAGGRPQAVYATQMALLALAVGGAMGLRVVAGTQGALGWTPAIAAAPGLASAVAIASMHTPPRLKAVGWTLMSTSTAAAVILFAGL